jgi:hypothetical protein
MEQVRAHDLAQSGAAFLADGRGAVDCKYVDSFAVAIPTAAGARTTTGCPLALSVRLDDALSHPRDERFYAVITTVALAPI